MKIEKLTGFVGAKITDFSCRQRWQAGDVAVWDNRLTLHHATNDYDGVRGLLYRITFEADRPS